MDPQVSWDQLLCAYAAGDWNTLEERATDLLAWLDRGGCPPSVIRQPDLGPDGNRALARAGCKFVLEMLFTHWGVQA